MTKEDLYKKVEDAFFNDLHDDVINIWNINNKNFNFDYGNEKDIEIIEAVTGSYIDNGNYNQALILVNEVLQNLEKLNNIDVSEDSDFTAFLFLKTIILSYKNKKLKLYTYLVRYKNIGGDFNKLLIEKEELEDDFFNLFLKFLKVCVIILSIPIIYILIQFFFYRVRVDIPAISDIIIIVGLMLIFNKKLKKSFKRIIEKLAKKAFKKFTT